MNQVTSQGCEFFVDLRPRTRRSVSISSVDSEPIKKAARVESAEPSDAEEAPAVPRPTTRAADAIDCPVEETAVSTANVALDSVSEAAIAVVTTVTADENICVAECAEDALVMDVGTRVCLEDGTFVGYVASVLGPVTAAVYVVASAASTIQELAAAGKVARGTALHYDLDNQRVMFNPGQQCAAAKGTDASYIHDDELPEHIRPDFSDDDEERRWKRERKQRAATADSVSSEESVADDVDWDKIEIADTEGNRTADTQSKIVVPAWLQ